MSEKEIHKQQLANRTSKGITKYRRKGVRKIGVMNPGGVDSRGTKPSPETFDLTGDWIKVRTIAGHKSLAKPGVMLPAHMVIIAQPENAAKEVKFKVGLHYQSASMENLMAGEIETSLRYIAKTRKKSEKTFGEIEDLKKETRRLIAEMKMD